jgi:hypothetical protein
MYRATGAPILAGSAAAQASHSSALTTGGPWLQRQQQMHRVFAAASARDQDFIKSAAGRAD